MQLVDVDYIPLQLAQAALKGLDHPRCGVLLLAGLAHAAHLGGDQDIIAVAQRLAEHLLTPPPPIGLRRVEDGHAQVSSVLDKTHPELIRLIRLPKSVAPHPYFGDPDPGMSQLTVSH